MGQLLVATANAFTKHARYVVRGEVVGSDEVDWKPGDPGFIKAPAEAEAGIDVDDDTQAKITAALAKFDGDGDGKPGGSKKKT